MRFPPSVHFSPSSAAAGSAAFTLIVNGVGFVTGATVNFNGAPKATTFSGKQLSAAIGAADIATAGTVNVVVTDPAPVGTSSAASFTINNPAPRDQFTVTNDHGRWFGSIYTDG